MSQILGLKFRDHGQVYYFDAGPFVVATGDHVLVQTEQGMGLGRVFLIREDTPPEVQDTELKKIFRLADEEDLIVQRDNEDLARRAFRFCRERISTRQMEMKLVDVEVYFDRGKVVFFFTAPGRIDFRELVKDLVREYRTRIELRQIGVRHETQMVGALGNCGQVCCCRRFMRKFAPVTIKMAKEQNLFLNPTKISGMCGRLLCCLSFEQENYEEFHRRCPKIGKRFQTKLGMVRTLRANLFNETVAILLESGEEREVQLSEWKDLLEVEAGEARPAATAPRLPARRSDDPSSRGEGAELVVLGEGVGASLALAEGPSLDAARSGEDRPAERPDERSSERQGDRRGRRGERRERRPDAQDVRQRRSDGPEGPERVERGRQREGGERPEAPRERGDRRERPERTGSERLARVDRPDRAERSDRPSRGDASNRSERSEAGDRAGRPQRSDRPERADSPEGRRVQDRRERPDGQREQGRRQSQPVQERLRDRSQEKPSEHTAGRSGDERRGRNHEDRAEERSNEGLAERLAEVSAERFVARLEDELGGSRADLVEVAQASGEGEDKAVRARRRRRKKSRPREGGQG